MMNIEDEKWWQCIVGPMEPQHLTGGKDAPMRDAIASAFHSIGGELPEHCFSGWDSTPTESERAVIENRPPRLYSLAEQDIADNETIMRERERIGDLCGEKSKEIEFLSGEIDSLRKFLRVRIGLVKSLRSEIERQTRALEEASTMLRPLIGWNDRLKRGATSIPQTYENQIETVMAIIDDARAVVAAKELSDE